MKKRLIPFVCALLCTVAACTSVHSDLTINEQRFGPSQCRNGQVEEFFGVDLKDERGLTLRLASNPDQTISVIVIPNDGRKPVSMTGCATLSLEKGDNDDHGHYKIDGHAQVNCSTEGWTVRGSTSFEKCEHEY